MTISLQDFQSRAAKGESRIRLSGSKKGTAGADLLATHKGSLAGRVVEWRRGNAQSQVAENKEVTRVFLDAIKTSYGEAGERAVSQQLKVDDGRPLKSSQVKQLIDVAEAAHTDSVRAAQRQQAIEARAASMTADVFSREREFNVFGLASSFFENAGHPGLAAQMAQQLRDPNSESSQAITKAVLDILSRNWPVGAIEIDQTQAHDLTRLVKATVIRTLLKHECGLIALQDEACTKVLLREPSIQVTAGNEIYEVSTMDVLESALRSNRLDGGLPNNLAHDLVDTAATLTGWIRPEAADMGNCRNPEGVERAHKLLNLAFDESLSLLSTSDAGAPTRPLTNKALTLRRDLQIAAATVGDGHGNFTTDADAIESAIDTECARLALQPGEPDLGVLNQIQDLACRARGCPGSLDGTTAANRRFLAQLREKANALDGNDGLDQLGFISSGMRQLTAQMIRQAIAVAGPAPAELGPDFKFEAISLGSTSRAEASVYSDVEFAFVLPENLSDEQVETAREHLQKVSILVRMQVKALGESGELGLPQKVHWDEAWNTPAESPEAFIGRPADLVASSFGVSDDHPTEANHFTMFANAEWLFSSDENGSARLGSTDLTEALHAATRNNLMGGATKNRPANATVLGKWLMNEGLAIQSNTQADRRPSHLLALIKAGAVGDLKVNVKQLSRLPMMLAQGLCLINGIYQENEDRRSPSGAYLHSTHMRAEALVRAGVLDRQQGDDLVRAMDLLGKVRIASHLANDRAEDEVALAGHHDLIEAITLLAPLETALREALADEKLRFPNVSTPVSSEPYTY